MLTEVTTFEPEIWIPPTIQSEDGFSAWSPLDLPNLLFWFKADQGTGGSSDGDSVTTWTDQSGNGVNPTEATNKPTYRTNVLNGLPVVRFVNTSNQKLQVAFTAMNSLAGRSVFIVFKKPSTGTAGNLISVDNSGPTKSPVAIQPWNDGQIYDTVYNDGTTYGNFAFSSTSFVLLSSLFDGSQTGNANRFRMFLNGVQKTLGFAGTIPSTTEVATKLTIGSRGDSLLPFNGDIAEIIATGAAVSAANQALAESYLNSKWAIY